VEAGELLVVGEAMGAGGAGAPGLEATGEVDDGGIGKVSGGMGVPAWVERKPLVGEDGIEGFLVEEVGGGAGLGEVLAGELGDVVLAPAGEINEKDAAVEIGGGRRDAAGGAVFDAAPAAAGADGLIDGGGEDLGGERGLPEGRDVGTDEEIGIEKKHAFEVGREQIGEEEGEGSFEGEAGGTDGGGELGRGGLDGAGIDDFVDLGEVGGERPVWMR
jgi:hypothetical protein